MWPLFDGPVGQADLRPAPQGWTVNNERSSVQSLLEELVSDLQDALGDDLIGTYLYGSYVSGGFDPGVSDLDLVTVTSRDADQLDLAGLERRGRLAVISPGEPFHLRDDPVVAWVQNWYLVRETGFALFGPPATSVVPSVSWPEFVDASRRYAAEIAAKDLDDVSPGYLAYSLLTLCRARRTVETGMDGSKQEAAAWARERDPDRAWLIDAALRCRHSGGTVGFDDPVTRSAAIAFLREFAVQSSAEVG
jgi:hypothetical protein